MIPNDYIVQKFYEYNGGVKYLKFQRTYQGSCFLCKEGKSWLKKKRCYFLTEKNVVCCHNCGWYSGVVDWLKEVTGLTFNQLLEDSKGFDVTPSEVETLTEKKVFVISDLPQDSINLLDKSQILFHKENKTLQSALKLLVERRLINAVNRPKTFWLSLTDFVHKNRLVIPFYNRDNKVCYYQTRSILSDDVRPKYLSKVNAEKSLYGIDSIDPDNDNIFIFEGPINAFFMKNGVAVCGIQENSKSSFTQLQKNQLLAFPFHTKIWVLDSQWIDTASLSKTSILLDQNERVFIWPKDVGTTFKDFNDICINKKENEVLSNFVLSNTYSGLVGKIKLAEIKRSKK